MDGRCFDLWKKSLGKLSRPYNLAVLLLLALMLCWLFILPHGEADNGDFYRVIHNMGLSYFSGSRADNYFNYFVKNYRYENYYIDTGVDFTSTQFIPVWLSIQLNNIFNHGFYDIRFLSLIYGTAYLAATHMILKLLYRCTQYMLSRAPQRTITLAGFVFTALYVLIFGDFSYLLYFNSFYGEPLSFVTLLLFVGIAGKIISSGRISPGLFTAYFACAVLFVGAKQQNAPTGFVIALFTLCLLPLSKGRVKKLITSFVALGIGVASIFTFASISRDFQYINQYHAMTMGIMDYTKSPEDLKSLGVSPQLWMLRNTTVYDLYPTIIPDSPLMYAQMYNRVSTIKFIEYYASHPNTLIRVLDSVSEKSYAIKPDMVGNFQKSEGKPALAKSYFFSLWGYLKLHIFPHSVGYLGFFFIALGIFLMIKFLRSRKAGKIKEQQASLFVISLILMSISQLAASFVGAGGADIAKHLFLYNMTYDMLFLSAVFWASCSIINLRIKP